MGARSKVRGHGVSVLSYEISKALDVLIKKFQGGLVQFCFLFFLTITAISCTVDIKCVHKQFYVKSSKNSEYLKRMDPCYPEILTFLELKKFLSKICSLEQFFYREKSSFSMQLFETTI